MKDPINLMLSARNKYVLIACDKSLPSLESILTDNDKSLCYREIYNTKEDVVKASKSACFYGRCVDYYYITSIGDVCNSDGLILYKRYKTHYIERGDLISHIYDNKGNYMGMLFHKLFIFNEDYTGKKGIRFIRDKAYPVFEYPEYMDKKPEILYTEGIKSIIIQDLDGRKIILKGFLDVHDLIHGRGLIGLTFNPNTKKGYVINTLTHALGGTYGKRDY